MTTDAPDSSTEKSSGGPKLVTHQFPIRKDLTVPVTLPVALTLVDAQRLAAFAMGLAFDDETDGGTR